MLLNGLVRVAQSGLVYHQLIYASVLIVNSSTAAILSQPLPISIRPKTCSHAVLLFYNKIINKEK
jgi:hypothetical protein